MPYLKFDNPKGSSDNKGSCGKFLYYISKEDYNDKENPLSKEFLFNHTSNLIPDYEAIEAIDSNRKGLGKNDAKFYTGSINFSEEELLFIGCNSEKIKTYTIKVMEQYAENFNRGISLDDLVWFAKIEQNRYYNGDDPEVVNGSKKQGQVKEKLNTHAHFIIGRKTKDGSKKISPKTNHRNTQKGPITGGFNRDEFKQQGERIFDEMFGYLRPLEETYLFNNVRVNGTIDEKYEMAKNHANELVKKETYAEQSVEQKEYRIQQLANYICHGIDKGNVKKIDVNALLIQERMFNHSGYVYRSLVNLNRAFKQGKIPNEYDLTEKVMDFAFYLESRASIHENENTIVSPIAFLSENKPEFDTNFNMGFVESITHSNSKDDLDATELLRRKKKGKKKSQDKGMSM